MIWRRHTTLRRNLRLIGLSLAASAALAVFPAAGQAAATGSVSPTATTFPDVIVGSTGTGQEFIFTNDGPDPIDITGISFGGTDSADFPLIDDGCTSHPQPLTVGENCTVNVAFAPTARGFRSADLLISHSGDNSPSTAALSGNGLLRQLTISPAAQSFPTTTVGANSNTQNVNVANNSDVAVSIFNVVIEGPDASDFNRTANDCGGDLQPGQNCNASIRFSPGSAGDKLASVHVLSNGTPSDTSSDLSGTASPAQLAFEPASYDFGLTRINQGNNQTNLQLRNTGAAPVQVNSLDMTGPDANVFNIGSSNCYGNTLQPNDTCSVQVYFNPQASASYAAQLRATTANNVSFTADLTGAGGQPILSASPNPADFGSTAVGHGDHGDTRTITVTNSGNVSSSFIVTIISGGDLGSFHVLDEDCTVAPLEPSGTCSAVVHFEPQGSGTKSAVLSFIGGSDPGVQVALTGVGVSATASLTPAVHDFGAQPQNTSGASQAFVVSNTDGTPLDLSGAAITGADAGQFRLAADNCTDVTLAPGEACVVRVRFGPDEIGPATARLRITGNAGVLTSSLAGTGVANDSVLHKRAAAMKKCKRKHKHGKKLKKCKKKANLLAA